MNGHGDLTGEREELRAAIRAAHNEGIPFAVIARRLGVSRDRVRQLYAGE